jgi:hypothetical protein
MPQRPALDLAQRASHAFASAVQHVGVDHGCPDVLMPKKFLDGPYVVTAFKQVGGEAMTIMPISA